MSGKHPPEQGVFLVRHEKEFIENTGIAVRAHTGVVVPDAHAVAGGAVEVVSKIGETIKSATVGTITGKGVGYGGRDVVAVHAIRAENDPGGIGFGHYRHGIESLYDIAIITAPAIPLDYSGSDRIVNEQDRNTLLPRPSYRRCRYQSCDYYQPQLRCLQFSLRTKKQDK